MANTQPEDCSTPERQFTWDDLKAAVGQDFSDGAARYGPDAVERWSLRALCEPFEMDCPLHWDDAAARRWGYRGVIAPQWGVSVFTAGGRWAPGRSSLFTDPCKESAYFEVGNRVTARPLPMPRTSQVFATDIEVEYYRPVYLGDRLAVRAQKLLSVDVKPTRVGLGAFVVIEREVINQDRELVAYVRMGTYHFNPHADKEGATG